MPAGEEGGVVAFPRTLKDGPRRPFIPYVSDLPHIHIAHLTSHSAHVMQPNKAKYPTGCRISSTPELTGLVAANSSGVCIMFVNRTFVPWRTHPRPQLQLGTAIGKKHNRRESPTSKYGAGETLEIEQVDML
jgi:hypothetical protein